MSKAKTRPYSMKFKSELRKHGKMNPQVSHPGQLSAKIKGIKQRPRYSIDNKQVLELPGYFKGCCMQYQALNSLAFMG